MRKRVPFLTAIFSLMLLFIIGTPARADVVLTAVQGAAVTPQSTGFYVKVLINNPSSTINGMSMVVDYADARGLNYELFGAGTGISGDTSKSIYLSALDKTPTRHQMLVTYVAKTPLAPSSNYSFLELYFSLAAGNHYVVGETLNITIRNIEVVNEKTGKIPSNANITVPIIFGTAFPTDPSFHLSVDQAYSIGPNSPEMMLRVWIENITGLISEMEMDITSDSNVPLAYGLYAAGTRFRRGYESNGGKYPDSLDAKDKWWTFLDFPVVTDYHQQAHLKFQVAVGPLLGAQPKFNFLQLYFHLINGRTLKNGQSMVIHINNIKVKLGDGSYNTSLPAVDLTVVSGGATDVFDYIAKPLAVSCWPNPASNNVQVAFEALEPTDVSLAAENGSSVLLQNGLTAGQQQFNANLSGFNPGHYFLIIQTGSRRQTVPLTIVR